MSVNLKNYFIAIGLFCSATAVLSQPQLVSSVPANGASGVSSTASVVFTFSEPMDTQLTTATFLDISDPFGSLSWSESWNSQMTILTCAPDPSWPVNKSIFWTIQGESLFSEPLDEVFGSFTTGTGSGGGGSGTNRITSFDVGKWYSYKQTSADAPAFDPEMSQWFLAGVTLASNRTANAVELKLPTAAITNLETFFAPEDYSLFDSFTNQTEFEARYPQGDYEFTVQAATSNQTVKLTMPANMQQPNAPHISNFAAAQMVDPTKPFTLTWMPFQGGTANDFIVVNVDDDFQTGELGETNALNGTATSVTIPANTLVSNTTYLTTVSFFRYVATTNNAQVYDTIGYRTSTTDLDLITTSSGTSEGDLVIENLAVSENQLTFEATTTLGQMVTLQTSATLQANSWQNVYTTNSPGTRVRFSVPMGSQPGATLVRLKNGS